MAVSMDQSHAGKYHPRAKWVPTIHNGEDLPQLPSKGESSSFTVAGPEGIVFTLYRGYYGFNLGHFMWDEVLSMFSLLHTFGLTPTGGGCAAAAGQGLGGSCVEGQRHAAPIRHVPFFVEIPNGHDPWYRCHPAFMDRWEGVCVKSYYRFFPPLLNIRTDPTGDVLRTGNWLQGREAIGKGLKRNFGNATDDRLYAERRNVDSASGRGKFNEMMPNTTYVLIPRSLAGIARLNNFGCKGDCAVGRAAQRYDFRNFLLRNILGSERFDELNGKAPTVYITFSLPGGSSRPHEVSFFENFIQAAKERYGDDRIRAEDMANLTWREQAELTMNSAIFVTNHGGGSATGIFVQRGGSVFLYHTKSKLDHQYWESLSYLRTVWIDEGDRNDTEKLMALADAELETAASSAWFPGLMSNKNR